MAADYAGGLARPPLGYRHPTTMFKLATGTNADFAAQPWMTLDPGRVRALVPSQQLLKAVQTRDGPLMWLPNSMIGMAVNAPFSTPLPGSKVRPGPHNLAILAALMSTSPQATVAGASLKGRDGSPRHREGSPVEGRSRIYQQPAMARDAPTAPVPTITSHVMVGALVPSHGRGSPGAARSGGPPLPSLPNQHGHIARRTGAQRGLAAAEPAAEHRTMQAAALDTSAPHAAGILGRTGVSTAPHGGLSRGQQNLHQQPVPDPLAGGLPARPPPFRFVMAPLAHALPVSRTPVLKVRPADTPASPDNHKSGKVQVSWSSLGAPNGAMPQPQDSFSPWGTSSTSPSKSTSLMDIVPGTAPIINPGMGLAGHVAAVRAGQLQPLPHDFARRGLMSQPAMPASTPLSPDGKHNHALAPSLTSFQASDVDSGRMRSSYTYSELSGPSTVMVHDAFTNRMLEPITPRHGDASFRHPQAAPEAIMVPEVSHAVLAAGGSAVPEPSAAHFLSATHDPTSFQAGDPALLRMEAAVMEAVGLPTGQQGRNAATTVGRQTTEADGTAMALASEVHKVLENLETELHAPLDEAKLVLKTRQVHYKDGPLPQLTRPAALLEMAAAEGPNVGEQDPVQQPGLPEMTADDVATGAEPGTAPGAQASAAVRSPMYTRRVQLPPSRLPDPLNLDTSQPPVSAAQDETFSAAPSAPLLPPNIQVDVDAAHQEATARLHEVEAAAAAAAKAAAAGAPGLAEGGPGSGQPGLGSRPSTRQGFAEVVASVGAALETAATQLVTLARTSSNRAGQLDQAAKAVAVKPSPAHPAVEAARTNASLPRQAADCSPGATTELGPLRVAGSSALKHSEVPVEIVPQQGDATAPITHSLMLIAEEELQQQEDGADIDHDEESAPWLSGGSICRPSSFYFEAGAAGWDEGEGEGEREGDSDVDMQNAYQEACAAGSGRGSDTSATGMALDEEYDGDLETDGEILSVSAFGITPTKPLIKSAGRRSLGGALETDVNDVVEGGVRLLGRKYEVLEVVGEGAYGRVLKCGVRGRPTQHCVAIKEFKITEGDADAEDVKRTSRREISLLRSLQHPHVVACLDDFFVRDRLFIVMEYVPCNLLELLEAQPGGMSSEAVRLIIYQLCTAMAYIHSQGVVYRDIKPENLLVDEQGRLKLCDFGFARFMPGGPEERLTDYVATRWYRAPELLLGPPFAGSDGVMVQYRYGPAIDSWAIGCLMGELKDGNPLFPGDSDLDQLYRIQAMLGKVVPDQQQMFDKNPANTGIYFNIKDPVSLAVRYEGVMDEIELSFMAGLLHMDPAKRMTCQQCLQHPYLADLWAADASQGEYVSSTNILEQVSGYTSGSNALPSANPGPDYSGRSSGRSATSTMLHPELAALAAP